jgi:hypothetical protein
MANDALVDGKDVLDALSREIGSWPKVGIAEHSFGGIEFRVGRRELGHIHPLPDGRSFADLPFPKAVRDELVATGRAVPHHVLPDSGWVTIPVRTTADLNNVIEIFRMNYDRSWSRSDARGVTDVGEAHR